MKRHFYTNQIDNLITGEYRITYPDGNTRLISIRCAESGIKDGFFSHEVNNTLIFGFGYIKDNIEHFRYVARIGANFVEFFQKYAFEIQDEVKLSRMVKAIELAAAWNPEITESKKAFALRTNKCVKCGRTLHAEVTLKELRETFGMGKKCFENTFSFAA